MSLNIAQVTIEDSLDARGKTCNLTLVPEDFELGLPPVAEFRFPGDSSTNLLVKGSGTNLRPDNAIINVTTANGTIFSGPVEFMSDLEDEDQFTYQVDLSNAPVNQHHRIKFSQVYNMVSPEDARFSGIRAHTMLKMACAKTGVSLGRVDLPNYNLCGTVEINNMNVMEIAQMLVAPFNVFDFLHYYVRCSERDGLQIIKIDYTKAGGVTNPYVLTEVKSKTRGYQRYMLDNRIGPGDVLITGGDRYDNANPNDLSAFRATTILNLDGSSGGGSSGGGSSGGVTIIERGEPDGVDSPYGIPEGDTIRSSKLSLTETVHASTRSENFGSSPGTSWTDTATTILYKCKATYPQSTATMGYGDMRLAVLTLAAGGILSLQVLSSHVIRVLSESYVDGKLKNDMETTYTYGFIKVAAPGFSNDSDSNPFIDNPGRDLSDAPDYKEVATDEQSISTEHVEGRASPHVQTHRKYLYDAGGGLLSTVTNTYQYTKGTWCLVGTTTDTSEPAGTVTAVLQQMASTNGAVLQEKALSEETRWNINYQASIDAGSSPEQAEIVANRQMSHYSDAYFPGTVIIPGGKTHGLRGNVSATPGIKDHGGSISKWRLLNGSSLSKTIHSVRENSCFQLSGPNMDLQGIIMIWNLCVQQRILERQTPYWEIIKITVPMDEVPAVGESCVAAGSSGIVESISHQITDSMALTTLSLRRLVFNV